MPPQTPNTPAQVPGEDVLRDTLRRSKINDDQRQQIWDAYHVQGGEDEFRKSMQGLSVPDDVRQTLWDMRFKGFTNQGNQATQQAPSPTAQQPKGAEPSSMSGGDQRLRGFSDFVGQAGKAFGEDVLGAISGLGMGLKRAITEGPVPQGSEVGSEVAQNVAQDVQRQKEGRSGIYRATAQVAPQIGMNVSGMEEDARQGRTGAVLGHTILPLLGLMGGEKAVGERGLAEGPIKGGVEAGNISGLTRENVAQLRAKGFSNQEMANWNASDVQAALSGSKKPTPAGRPTEAVPGAKASATNQSAAAPATSQVSSVPTKGPEPTPATHQGDLRGATGPLRSYDPTGNRFATGGTIGMEQIDPAQLIAPPPKGPSTYTPSEKAATMAAPRPSLGPEFELGEVKHEIDRNRAIIESDTATPEDKRVAQSRMQEGLIVQAPPPINRGSQAGVTPPDPYYKPAPPPLVPSSEVDPPAPKPVEDRPRSIVPRSHELPSEVQSGLDLMMSTKKLIDNAKTPEAKAAAQNLWDRTAAITKTNLRNHFDNLTPQQLVQLQGDQEAIGSRHEQQGQAITDIMAGDKMAQAIRAEMATGAPVRAFPGTTTQFSKASGTPLGITGTTIRPIRDALHELLGDQTSMEFDQVSLNRRAKARDEGLDPDTIQPEGYVKLTPEEYQAKRLEATIEKREIQDKLKADLKGQVADRLSKNVDLIQSQGPEEAEKTIHAQVLKEIISAKDEHGRTIVERLKDLDKILGRDPQRPIYKKKGEPIVTAEGVVKAPGDIPAKSLAVARRIWGKQLNKIPDDAAWQKKADEHLEKGRLAKAISKGIDAVLKVRPPKGKAGEAGVIGEATPPTKSTTRSDIVPKDLDPIKMLANAKAAGLEGHQVTDEQPAGEVGWLSPDGNVWIDKGNWDHADVSDMIFPKKRNPMFGMLDGGWLRKAANNNYEVAALTQQAIETIHLDMLRNRGTNHTLYIDAQLQPGGKLQFLQIEPGVENLTRAINQERRRVLTSLANQAGVSGVVSSIGFGLGAVAGTVAGAIHGGVTGAIVGGTVGMAFGFLAPAVLTSLPVQNAMKIMANIVRSAGVSLKTWFEGPPQTDIKGISPELDRIMEVQRLHNEPETTWLERAKLLPSELYNKIDPVAFIADQRNMSMTGKIMMSLDPRGRVFRDLKIPDTASLYLAVSNARADALGLRADKGMQYSEVKSDANKAGLRPLLNAYLNLAAYKRANEVVQEHIQDLSAQIQNRQTKLQSPSLSEREKYALEEDLKDLKKKEQELVDKIHLGNVTPGGFTPTKIQDVLTQFEQAHPQEYAQVEQLAKRVFAIRAPILDLLLDNGIISQEAYIKYKGRGDEYIPMQRIMDDLEPQKGPTNLGPLDLKHQTVIKRLEGSERENLDPWEAIDGDDRRAFNNIIRNGVMKKLLDLAQAYPNIIGQELTPVKVGYQPKAGEGVLGHYDNGKVDWFAVPKYLEDTLTVAPLATEMGFNVLSRWMEHTFKKGATIYKLGFMATSTLTHALSSMMLSKYGASPLPTEVIKFARDWRKAAIEVYKNGPAYRELVKGGASFGGFDTLFSPERYTSPDEVGLKSRLKKMQILETMADFVVAMENANRTNILMRGLKAGATLQQALFEARQFGGAPNFGRMGPLNKFLNHGLMFINAHAQYPFQVMAGIRKNPARVLPWIAVLTAMNIAVTSYNLMVKDPNGVSSYRKISTYDRERNTIVMTPWTYSAKTGARLPIAIKIPKNYLTQMVVNPTEEIMTYAIGHDARTGTQQALDAVSAISPIHLNLKEGNLKKSAATSIIAAAHPLAKLAIQQYANVDDFGRPIANEKMDEPFQEGPYTSATAERIGQGGVKGAVAGGALGGTLGAMFGLPGAGIGAVGGATLGAIGGSPQRIDNAGRTLTGSMSSQAETMLDPFFGGMAKRRQLAGTEKAISTPVVGGLAKAFLSSPQDAEYHALSEQFHTVLQHAQMIKYTADQLLKSGRAEESARFIQENQAELFRAMSLNSLDQLIKKYGEMIKQLQMSPDVNTPAGRQALESVYEARTDLLRRFRDLLASPDTKSSDTGPMANPISNSGSIK